MKVKNLLKDLRFETNVSLGEIENLEIKDVAYNSNKAGDKIVFVALEGESTDGHRYIDMAYDKGSRIFIVSKEVELAGDCIKILVKDTRLALSKISNNLFHKPSEKMKIIGITGTKGKTTTSNYIKAILEEAGHKTGIIGTNGVFYGHIKEETINTTPESYEIQRILRAMLEKKIEFVVMEVSSGGLKMNRVEDIEFDLAIFTNISRDHIGPREHPDFEDYLDCKSKLFKLAKHGYINIDDKYGQYIIDNSDSNIGTFSIEKNSDFKAEDIEFSKSINSLASSFKCKTKDGLDDFKISSPGIFTIYNALASIAAASYFGIDFNVINKAFENINVSGRAEVLPILDYASVVLDFAHNEVSLRNIVETLKAYKPNRLVCLVGSVGGRTIIRRKGMGDVAAAECDVCILTSDNPDFEDPIKIIDEMSESFTKSDCLLIKEVDREKAIIKAINLLKKNDILLLAGKGHEEYDLVKGEKLYFSDKEVAISAAAEIMKNK